MRGALFVWDGHRKAKHTAGLCISPPAFNLFFYSSPIFQASVQRTLENAKKTSTLLGEGEATVTESMTDNDKPTGSIAHGGDFDAEEEFTRRPLPWGRGCDSGGTSRGTSHPG